MNTQSMTAIQADIVVESEGVRLDSSYDGHPKTGHLPRLARHLYARRRAWWVLAGWHWHRACRQAAAILPR